MPGQRIYYVPPRLVGPVSQWSGLEEKGGQSWLVEHVADLKFNAVWFSPFTVTTAIEKPVQGKSATGSYYGIRDHFRVDPEFSTGDDDLDKRHIRHFCAEAKKKGVRSYADLVFNHVARDHAAVIEEEKKLQDILRRAGGTARPLRGNKDKVIGLAYMQGGEARVCHFKFRRNDDFSLTIGGPPEDPWSDVAQVNYSSPEGRRFFVDGDKGHKGYFKQVIDWYMDLGFTGFRCDAAWKIPPESWQELISYAHDKSGGDVIFMAETFSLNGQKVDRMAEAKIKGKGRVAFDLGMSSLYWWDYHEDWLPKGEAPKLNAMSRFGGAGSPDNCDTEDTLAGGMRKTFNQGAAADAIIADVCVRDYIVSTFACNSHFMQMGFEYGNEKQNRVFRGMVTPKDWKDLTEKRKGKSPLDLTARIRAANALKEQLGVDNCRAEIRDCRKVEGERLELIRIDYVDVDSDRKKAEVTLLLNRLPEKGPVSLSPATMRDLKKSGLIVRDTGMTVRDALIWHTPLAAPSPQRKNQPKIK